MVPHTARHKYGTPVNELVKAAPKTSDWLNFYHDKLLASRIQNGKFFNANTQPYYRLDNVGEYTYVPYKVLWKEQPGSMSAVVGIQKIKKEYIHTKEMTNKQISNEDSSETEYAANNTDRVLSVQQILVYLPLIRLVIGAMWK